MQSDVVVAWVVAVIDKVQDQLEAAKPGPLVDEVVCTSAFLLSTRLSFHSLVSCFFRGQFLLGHIVMHCIIN